MNTIKEKIINPGFLWFLKNSYNYITDRTMKSKVDFAIGLIPSWIMFCKQYNGYNRYG